MALGSSRLIRSIPQSKSSTRNIFRNRSLVRNAESFVNRSRNNGLFKPSTERQRSPNRVATATLASVLFFPQRPVLQLNGRAYSPCVVERVVAAAGLAKSYQSASKLLSLLTDIQISKRQINNLTVLIGEALQQDQQVKHDVTGKSLPIAR